MSMRRVGLLLTVIALVLDQASKQWALAVLSEPGSRIEVLPFWNMVLVWNHGVSFGLFGGGAISPLMLAGVTGLIGLGVAVWLATAKTWLVSIAAGMILGGAIGNIIDRLVYGAVVDFIDWHAYGYFWPVFNVADIAITLGVGVLIIDSFFGLGSKTNLSDQQEKKHES
ncbi:MAG: signal peptidase II [Alphaproteobacteria bacterium]|jgi:signal peptidase II